MKIFVGLLLAAVCGAVRADVVTMGNGDKITGTIEEVNPKVVVVKTPYAGEMKIDRAAVKTLRSEETVKVVRDTGEEKRAYLSPVTGDGKGWQETAVALPPPVEVPATPKRSSSYLYLGPDWTNQLAVGAVNNTGNDNTTTFSGDLNFHYLKKPSELTLKFQALYGRSNGTQTAGLFDENLVYRKDINPKWYWYADDDARYDAIKGLTAQVAGSTGVGYYFYNTDKFKLDLRAGPAVTYTQTFAGRKDISPGAEGGIRLNYVINDRMTATHETTYTTSGTDLSDWRIHSDTALLTKIDVERGLGLKLDFADDYEDEPSVGRKRNDTRLTLSVTLDF